MTTGGTLLERSTMGAGTLGEEQEASARLRLRMAVQKNLGKKPKAVLGAPTCTLLSWQTVLVIDLDQLKVFSES
ncbi:MAG: hypothetical protein FJY62_10325 [Betaproteobacteria bacterium]|nr:hypothetical protein [Betaproteobacteria bacterium]